MLFTLGDGVKVRLKLWVMFSVHGAVAYAVIVIVTTWSSAIPVEEKDEGV